MRIIRTAVFVSFAGVMLRGAQETANQNSDEPVATVTYCQLLKDPQRFHNKVVRVNAVFGRQVSAR